MKLFTREALKLGLRTADLAEACEVTTQTIYLWKSGQSIPHAEHIKKLAEVLKMDPDKMIDDFHGS